MPNDQRFILGVAYQSGYDSGLSKGADGFTDYVDPADLEWAAWGFMRNNPVVGLNHEDGTTGHVEIVESYIYRGPDWVQADGTVIKAGDWLLAGIVDEETWPAVERGDYTGWSPEGTGRRVRGNPN